MPDAHPFSTATGSDVRVRFCPSPTGLPHVGLVRTALFNRNAGHDEMLAGLPVPALVMHGTDDAIVDLSAAEHALAVIPGARPALWEGGGHAPFLENEGRFISEIDQFIDLLDAAESSAAATPAAAAPAPGTPAGAR